MFSKKSKLQILRAPYGDSPHVAMFLLLFGVFLLAFQDSIVKFVSSNTSFWQFQTLRAFGNLCFLLCLSIFADGLPMMMPKNWRPVLLRGVFLTICMFFFFSGAPFLSVSQMATGLYTYPLFVSLLAGPILSEKIGRWRILALIIGASGAILMLDPFGSDFSSVQVLPVIAGFFYATNIITLRGFCRNESPVALASTAAALFCVSGICGALLFTFLPLPMDIKVSMPFISIGWPELTAGVLFLAFVCSILNVSGNLCLSRAYQTAESSRLAPLDFSYLLFAVIWGQILFNSWPDSKTTIGMVMIASAGMLTVWREQAKPS